MLSSKRVIRNHFLNHCHALISKRMARIWTQHVAYTTRIERNRKIRGLCGRWPILVRLTKSTAHTSLKVKYSITIKKKKRFYYEALSYFFRSAHPMFPRCFSYKKYKKLFCYSVTIIYCFTTIFHIFRRVSINIFVLV